MKMSVVYVVGEKEGMGGSKPPSFKIGKRTSGLPAMY